MDVEPVAVEQASVAWVHARREVTVGFALVGAGALGAVAWPERPRSPCAGCGLEYTGLELGTIGASVTGGVLLLVGTGVGAHANGLAGIRTSTAPLAVAAPLFAFGVVATVQISRNGDPDWTIPAALATGVAVVGLGALQWHLDVHDAYAADVHVVLAPSGANVVVRW